MIKPFHAVAAIAVLTATSAVAAEVSPQSGYQTIQQQFSVTRNKPQVIAMPAMGAGQVRVELTFRGEPLSVAIRNAAGQVLTVASVRQPSGQAVFNITEQLLKSSPSFSLLLASNGNSAGQIRITSLKPQTALQSQTAAPLTVQPAVRPLKNLAPVANWESRIRAEKVRVAEGVEFGVKDYIQSTSFRNSLKLRKAFDAGFQSRQLKRPLQYTEDVQDLGDRLYVKRTMLLDAKNPCDPEIEQAGLSLCFKPSNKPIQPETKQYLDQVRAKIKLRVTQKPFDAESIRVKPFLSMTDAQLLDHLLNRETTAKVITHESVVPYVAYEFRKVPAMEMFDFRMPIPRLNQLTSINAPAATVRPGAAASASGINVGSAAGITQQGNINQNALQAAQGQESSTPTPYTFPTTKEMSVKALTGWTIGKSFGDKFEVEFADSTWFTDRYYARFTYNVSAGFGMRWPFEIKATSTVDKVYGISNQNILDYPATQICQGNFARTGEQAKANAHYCAQRATVNVQAIPVNGDAAFYRATGLANDKIFDGKEFVFEVGATCKFYASIPGPNLSYSCPSSLKGFNFSRDFTPQLGPGNRELVNFTVKGHDIGLELGFRFGYGALNPGMTLSAGNGNLKLGVEGYQAIPSVANVILGTAPATFTVRENNAAGPWGIDLYDPRYSVTATLTPTLGVSIGVDLGIYEWNKTFGPYKVDSLGITLGTASFNTHSGTKGNFEMHNIGTRPPR